MQDERVLFTTGDPMFDDAFLVETPNRSALLPLLLPPVREALLHLLGQCAFIRINDTTLELRLRGGVHQVADLADAVDRGALIVYALCPQYRVPQGAYR